MDEAEKCLSQEEKADEKLDDKEAVEVDLDEAERDALLDKGAGETLAQV